MQKLITALTLGLVITTPSFADQATLEKNLKINYPNLNAKVLKETPISNIYEVQIADNLVYTNEDARYFFIGSLIDLKNKENLSMSREQEVDRIDVSKLPLENAIKHVKGNGERIIYLFSDPDCPYCQNFEKELTSVDNITIYIFMFPIVSLHPNAGVIAQKIWCSNNRYEAWEDYLLHGKAPHASTACDNPIDENVKLGRELGVSGTPSFFLKNGELVVGGRDADELEEILKAFE